MLIYTYTCRGERTTEKGSGERDYDYGASDKANYEKFSWYTTSPSGAVKDVFDESSSVLPSLDHAALRVDLAGPFSEVVSVPSRM